MPRKMLSVAVKNKGTFSLREVVSIAIVIAFRKMAPIITALKTKLCKIMKKIILSIISHVNSCTNTVLMSHNSTATILQANA